MKTMVKKLACWLLTLAMCLTLVPAFTPDAKAAAGTPCSLELFIDGEDRNAGTVACSKPKGPYYTGESITVRATANPGYTFVGWVNYVTQEVVETEEFTFVLQGDTEWTVIFKKDGEYFIYVNKPYGLLTASPEKSSYAPGTQVTLSVPEESGRSVVYEVADAIEDTTVEKLNWQRLSGSTFVMPNNDVWVRALYSINLTLACGEHGTATLSPTGPYYEGDTVTLTLKPDDGYYAQSVSGTTEAAVDGDTLTFTLNSALDRTINIQFAPKPTNLVRFFTSPADGGTVTVSVDEAALSVTATAVPSNGYHFLCWMDMDTNEIFSRDTTLTFQPTRSMQIRAVFYLNVAIDPNIQHGTLEIVNKKTLYSSGDTVTLLATPDEGYIVNGYYAGEVHDGSATLQLLEGNSFVMPAWDMAASVEFVKGYTVRAAASSEEGGTVFGAGTYKEGTDVVLTALPAEGYTFMGWAENGATVSTDAVYSFTAEANRDLTAIFQEYTGMTFAVSASAVPAEGGTITGAGEYQGGDTVTLSAVANLGYTFLNWSENGTVVSDDAEYRFTANANRTLTASFQSDAGVSYVDASGDPKLCASYMTLTSGTAALGTGWYAVAGNVTIGSRINVSGSANLILCDGAVLTIPKGIHLTGSNSLTIWGQSHGTGALVIERPDENNAGVGGNNSECGGVFTMNGGTLTVTGGECAAGIGGGGDSLAIEGWFNNSNCGKNTRGWAGTIVINGGTVAATGGERGAGIGCGQRGNGGSITITGGTIVAKGGLDSAAIGGAESSITYHQSIDTICITGGDVTATGGKSAAAIGGGLWCRIGNVTIDGGTVRATGGEEGAGIGCGYFGADGQITINDGDVTAVGGEDGAGIGGGRCLYGTVKITGGTIHATGGPSGAGIGGGYNLGTDAYSGGSITITGGDVTAVGGTSRSDSGAGIGGGAYGPGGNITISGGTVRASGGSHAFCNGAGIGGGHGAAGGTVIISDGNVNATGGVGGAGIGSGSNYGNGDTLSAGTVAISGGSVTASGGKYAAGIGGGYGVAGGNVTISGGDNTVTGGGKYSGSPSYGGGGAGIGGGYNAAGGSFTFTGGTTWVAAGDWDDSDHRPQAVGHGDHVDNCDGDVILDAKNAHVRVGYVQSWGARWADAAERATYARNYGFQVIFQSCEAHSYDRNGVCALCGATDGPVLQDISYVNAAGQPQGDAVCQPLSASNATWDTSGVCRGWYAVTKNVTIDSRVTVSGNVNLILCDNATLTVPKGVEVSEGNSLTIWRQSGATGALHAGSSCAAGDAGIGGGSGKDGGTITVYGGSITAAAGEGAQAVGHGTGASDAGNLNLLCMRTFDSAEATKPVDPTSRTAICRGSFVKLTACTEHHMVNGVCGLCDLHESVSYADPADGKQHTCLAYIPYTGQPTLTDGWYVLASGVTTTGRAAVTGDVNLILPDGRTWNAAGGVMIHTGGSLTVWAQSDGADMGALTAAGARGQAGIENTGGALTVNGGAVTATGGENAAGVGGASNSSGGTVTVNGGTLTAVGGANAQAIGCGSDGAEPGEFNINGFKAGYVGASGTVAQWAAVSTREDVCRNTSGAKIRLERCASHEDDNSDGFCDLCAVAYYFDPSGGNLGLCVDYTPYRGQETLNTGWYVLDASREISQRVSVSGNVNLILMDGVELTALRGIRVAEGDSLTIWARSTDGGTVGKLSAAGTDGNAGIGGNSGENGGSVTFRGGTITAVGGEGAQAIGGGSGSGRPGDLNLDVMRVGTVDSENSVSWVNAAERVSACRSATQTIRLAFCTDHSYTVFTDNGNGTHTPHCAFCAHNGPAQAHAFNDEHLCACGAADGIPYVDPTDATHPVKVCHGSVTTVTKNTRRLTTGWYVVSGKISKKDQIIVAGDVNLILCDGAKLESSDKITVNEGNSLTVWGQSGGTGCIAVTCKDSGSFTCIGGTDSKDAGSITINGGTITVANPKGGTSIGGGGKNASVTINGGAVSVTSCGVGIGGVSGRDGGNITITGGTVTVNAAGEGAGIGGGGDNNHDNAGGGGNITISGGTVTVDATGTGVGIGGGSTYEDRDHRGGDGGNITISGGIVTVNTAGRGAGIGGGNSGGDKCGGGGTVVITGGTVVVNGVGKWAIGPGVRYYHTSTSGKAGSLTLGDYMTVTAGRSEKGAQSVSADERVKACQSNRWVKIEPGSSIPTTTYALTVVSGTGGGDYTEGASVTVTADAAPSGKVFDKWTFSADVYEISPDTTNASISFKMPAQDVTVTATYKDAPTTYAVTYKVVNGTWADGAAEDRTESVAGGAKPSCVPVGMIASSGFTGGAWDSNPYAATITEATTFTYSFAAITPTTYTVTVTNDGHGTGFASPASGVSGTEVALTATPASGYHFKAWQVISGGVSATDNRFTIGVADAEVKAIFEADTPAPTPTPSGRDRDETPSSATAATPTASETRTNADGSKTDTSIRTTETKNADGSVTATTTETAATTAADGSKTETKTETSTTTKGNSDGSTTATTTATETATMKDADGRTIGSVEARTEAVETLDRSGNGTVEATTTETVKDAAGNVTVTTVTESKGTVETATDGTKTTTTTHTAVTTDAATGEKTTVVTTEQKAETPNGTTASIVQDMSGNAVSAEANVSRADIAAAQRTGEPVQIPMDMPAASANDAARSTPIQIEMPDNALTDPRDKVYIEIGVDGQSSPGVIAMQDGKPVKECYEGSVILPVYGSCEIVIVDNTKTFADVGASKWYYEYVAFAAAREIFNGTGGGRFEPDAPMTRAMLVQMLYNFTRGVKAGDGTAFTDVNADNWFNAAVGWALENGIVNAAERFCPQDSVSRQDMATMLYRYAKWAGYDVSAHSSLSQFADAGEVADYAADAMRWAVGTGLIDGVQYGTSTVVLDPRGSATRAQVAAITTRFVRNAK